MSLGFRLGWDEAIGASYFSSSFLFDILGADGSGPGAGTVGVRRGMTHRARCATLAHLCTFGVGSTAFDTFVSLAVQGGDWSGFHAGVMVHPGAFPSKG